MKKIISSTLLLFMSTALLAQTLTWSPMMVKPKQKNVFTALDYAGISNNQYQVIEYDGGGVSLSRKVKSYMHAVDGSTMNYLKEQDLNSGMQSGKDDDYVNALTILMNDRNHSFFVDRTDKKLFTVYGVSQNLQSGTSSSPKTLFKMDLSKNDMAGMSKFRISLLASSNLSVYKSFDNKTILSAYISETVDKDYSMMTVTEMDQDLNTIQSASYKIPFKSFQPTVKTIMGPLPEGDPDAPYIGRVMKEANGMIYVMFRSSDPLNKKGDFLPWIATVKLNEPSYLKLLQKELPNNISPVQSGLRQDENNGQIYFFQVGKEIEKEKDRDERYFVNTQYIGRFNASGELETLVNKRFPTTTMYHFDTEKRVNKKDAVNSLSIINIAGTSDGGFYVVWQHDWTEYKSSGQNTITYLHLDNLLIQRFSKPNKLAWEKPIYKRQSLKHLESGFIGLKSFCIDDELFLFYPDDSKNAAREASDKDVNEFTVVKFGGKDLAGFFLASFDKSGKYSRKYINWPEDKMGFALDVNSIYHKGGKEFIGTARKIKQGALLLKSEEFAFFKLKL